MINQLPRFLAQLLLLGALLFAPGCATTTTEVPTPPKELAAGIELAVYTGSWVYLRENPDARVIFVSVAEMLEALVSDPTLSATKFAEAMQRLPIRELKDEEAVLIVNTVMILWTSYKDSIPIVSESAEYIRPLVIRARNGLGLALGLPPFVAPSADTQDRVMRNMAPFKR